MLNHKNTVFLKVKEIILRYVEGDISHRSKYTAYRTNTKQAVLTVTTLPVSPATKIQSSNTVEPESN